MQTKRATSVALIASTLVTIVALIGLNCDAFGIQASDASISGKQSANLAALAAVSQFPSDAEPIVSNGQESAAPAADQKQLQQQESQVASQSAEQQSSLDKQQRKGRADEQGSPSALTATPKAEKTDKADKAPASQPAAGTKQDASTSSTSATKSTKPVKSTSSNQQAKIGAKKAGPVTSTGNSGSHYLSKHDSYSAIAERHLFTDAMRKSDRRRAHSSMSGIEKAASFGNMFSNPLNGITDNGLARTLGASMRSMIKGKYSVPAYVASALLGAVALLAFYESPISPLPVPPLPEPPVGRFPPEMPNISPNLQVPFRTSPSNNAQQQYNQMLDNYQRSSYQPQQFAVPTNSQQQSSSIMFPSSPNSAQSRSGNQQQASSSPIASLLPESVVGKSQAAQRKSSVDYELPLASRTLFGDYSALFGKQQPQLQLQVGQQLQPKSSPSTAASSSTSSSGILSYFGLGSSDSATSPVKVDAEQKNSNPSASSSLTNSIANSYLVTKVRSMFKASPVSASPASASASASAPSPLITSSSASAAAPAPESGKKLSLMQSLIKDSNFLPAFFSPSRKSPASSSSQSNSANPAAAASSAQAQQHQFAERANQGSNLHYINSLAYIPQQQQQQQQQSQLQAQQTAAASKQSTGGYSLVKATERIAHALLDSIQAISTPRHAAGSSSMARKSPANDDKTSIASAASLINDMVSGYSNVATSSVSSNQDKQSAISQANKQLQQQSPEQLKSAVQKAVKESQVNARSDVQGSISQSSQQQVSASAPAPQSSSAISNSESLQQASASVSAVVSAVPQQDNQANQQREHVRKTRSIGLDYPINSQYQQHQYQQQVDQSQLVKPSRAAQINSVVDFVADSYTNNKLLFNLVMSQVGLANAVPYVDQILSGGEQQVN